MKNVAFFVYDCGGSDGAKLAPMSQFPFILASGSPRRKLLLKQIGLRFKAVPSRAPESLRRNESASENAERLALAKAREVARRFRSGVIIGADTIVVVGTKILGKPKNGADARRMLGVLSGRVHSVYTGLALVEARTGRFVSEVVRTRVTFRKLSPQEIDVYVKSGSPMDKAGAYGIQDDYGAVFVEKVDGCFYNVMGFPLSRFYEVLQQFLAVKRT